MAACTERDWCKSIDWVYDELKCNLSKTRYDEAGSDFIDYQGLYGTPLVHYTKETDCREPKEEEPKAPATEDNCIAGAVWFKK